MDMVTSLPLTIASGKPGRGGGKKRAQHHISGFVSEGPYIVPMRMTKYLRQVISHTKLTTFIERGHFHEGSHIKLSGGGGEGGGEYLLLHIVRLHISHCGCCHTILAAIMHRREWVWVVRHTWYLFCGFKYFLWV